MQVDVSHLKKVLDHALQKRIKLGFSPEHPTQAFRWIHAEADGWSDAVIDIYAGFAVLQFYVEYSPEDEHRIAEAVLSFGAKGIYIKRRPRQANIIVDAKDSTYAPKLPIVGRAAPDPLEVREDDLPFLVRLGEGLSTGLFLDQRDNRRRVRAGSKNMRVLNLFSYTGAFSIAAGMGDAREVVNIDASKQTCERARENIQHAEMAGPHKVITEDVFTYLKRLTKRRDVFDAIVVDPPSYAKTKSSRFNTQKDYLGLMIHCLGLVNSGWILACSNLSTLQAHVFAAWADEALERTGRRGSFELFDPPPDFPMVKSKPPHLKSLWFYLE